MYKKSLLKDLRVEKPCSEDWEEMTGNEKVRFCSHCDLDVNNISTMSKDEALNVVKKSNNRICVRYVQHPKTKAPIFREKLYQITRQTGVAAGVLGATLAVNSVTYAQGQARSARHRSKPATELSKLSTSKNYPKTEDGNASISGLVTDQVGAVIPNAKVELISKNVAKSTITNNEGFYEFKNLPEKEYKMTVSAEHFKTQVYKEIKLIGANASLIQNSQMPVAPMLMHVSGAIAVSFSIEKPLVKAVYDGKVRKVKSLIAHGTNVNEKDKEYFSRTALHVAVFHNELKMVEILLNAGADANSLDENGNTPLMLIDEETSDKIVKLLIRHGTNLDIREKESKRTALINAAMSDNFKALELLIKAGANVTFRDEDGDSAIDLVENEKLRDLLIAYGATENTKH